MVGAFLLLSALLQATASPQASAPPPTAPQAASKDTGDTSVNSDDPAALLKVKRIFVDSFGDDIISKELQSMVVSSLVATKRFKVTENRERADAVLKGVALEQTSHEVHAFGEGTSVGVASGSSSGNLSGSVVNGNGSVSGSSSGGFIARHMGTNDSSVNTETVNNARVAIRLVSLDGDVLWTTTQESKGAKYKGASADVADMCVKQLIRDVDKLEAANKGAPPVPATASSH